MSLQKKISLREGERIIRTVHRYGITDWWKYLIGFGFLAGASFLMFQLFSYGVWGYIAYGLMLAIGLFIWSFSGFRL